MKKFAWLLLSGLLVFSACTTNYDVPPEQKLSRNWKLTGTHTLTDNIWLQGDSLGHLLLNPENSKGFIFNVPQKGIKKSGHWSLKDSILVLSCKLPVIESDIDSVVYKVIDDKPALVYYRDGKEITRYFNEKLFTGREVLKFRLSVLTETKLVLEGQDVRYTFAYIQPPPKFKGDVSVTSVLRGLLGLLVLIIIAWLFSSNKKAISWKVVGTGLLIQLVLAIGILKVSFVQKFFEVISSFFVIILDFTREGSVFLLGDLMDVNTYGFIFTFQVLPTIIFFAALTSVLFYLGIIQKIVYGLAWTLAKALKLSGAESLSVAGNIFLGQTESPLMIKAYLEKMNNSEILLVMIGGMATIAGGVMAAYISFLGGDDPIMRLYFAKHLLAASIMAAPGAIVVSKILVPQTEPVDKTIEITQEKIGSNFLDAIANGTTEGLRLAANVAAMLLVFVAFIAMANFILRDFLGKLTGLNAFIADLTNNQYNGFSLQFILGYTFAPLMWLIGVGPEDMSLVGRLLGEKIIMNEFIAYVSLAELKDAARFTSEKSIIMATYMLCGFANFASIGIQIGGIGTLAPNKRKLLAAYGIKALIGGTIASLLSATIVGMLMS